MCTQYEWDEQPVAYYENKNAEYFEVHKVSKK
jgi:hypothetical protein